MAGPPGAAVRTAVQPGRCPAGTVTPRYRSGHEGPGVNIAHLLRHAARCFAERPAITWRGTTIDHRTFDAGSAAFAGWLGEVGAASGERVVLYLDNHPDLLVAMFGTFRAGAAAVPANARLTEDELAFLIGDSAARVVVTDPVHADTARRAAAGAAVVVVPARSSTRDPRSPAGDADVADVPAEATAWIFYTSGTTGRPKGAMLSHGVLNFVTVSWLADLTPLTEHDVTLHAAPLSHGAGFHALAAVARAAHQVIADSGDSTRPRPSPPFATPA